MSPRRDASWLVKLRRHRIGADSGGREEGMPVIKTWEGKSKTSFAKAAEAAVLKAERDLKRRRQWRPPHQLRVVDMYVTVTNPIGDYIVVLGTGG
jgi:hypothetical protein